MKFFLVAAAYGMIFVVIELIALRLHPPEELARKLSHILAGIGAALAPFVLSFQEIALLGAIFVPAVLISMRFGVFKKMHGVSRRTYGEVYFPLAIALSALLFPDQMLFMYGILVLGVSDALASLLGLRYGRKKYKLKGGHTKSYFGSAVFFVSTVVIGYLLSTAYLTVDTTSAVVWSILLAGALTVIEALCSKGLDNLFVPLSASGLLGFVVAFGLLGN